MVNFMKNLVVVGCLLALLTSGHAYSDVRGVAGGDITFSVAGSYHISSRIEQDVFIPESSDESAVNVSEHLVIRTATSKISFTPLSITGDVSPDSVNAARGLLRVRIPETYLNVMTLYQSFGGSSQNVCKFLVLDELLDTNRRQSLKSILEEAGIEVVARNGFQSFDCHRGGTSNG